MVNDSLLKDIQDLEKPVLISTVKSGERLWATKMGKIRLKSIVGKHLIKSIELYNVFFIPELEENLLSVRKDSKSGKGHL